MGVTPTSPRAIHLLKSANGANTSVPGIWLICSYNSFKFLIIKDVTRHFLNKNKFIFFLYFFKSVPLHLTQLKLTLMTMTSDNDRFKLNRKSWRSLNLPCIIFFHISRVWWIVLEIPFKGNFHPSSNQVDDHKDGNGNNIEKNKSCWDEIFINCSYHRKSSNVNVFHHYHFGNCHRQIENNSKCHIVAHI